MSNHRPETIALHGGQVPDPTTGSRAVPIYQTTSYVFDDTQHAADLFALKVPGNIYTRIMNPTQDVFEQRVTQLEGGIAAVATASGQSAVSYSVLNIARAGDNIISVSTLYGGTYNLFAHTLPQYGVEVRWADPDDPGAVAALTDENTKLVFAETIGNPKLNVIDIRAWADAAHAQGLPLIVDNTVLTPILARVFEQGADIATDRTCGVKLKQAAMPVTALQFARRAQHALAFDTSKLAPLAQERLAILAVRQLRSH